MRVLVLHDAIDILAWLVDQQATSAEAHITNGYPHLLADWQAGKITAVEIDVPTGDEHQVNLYAIVDNGNGPGVSRRAQ